MNYLLPFLSDSLSKIDFFARVVNIVYREIYEKLKTSIGRLGAQMVQVELPYLIANLNERHIEEGSVLCQKIRIIGQLVIFL